MGKYDPLRRFLEGRDAEEVPMTFAEIERVLGARLPDSKGSPAWWSNNPNNNVMTRAWLAAGYRSERVDVGGESVVFRRGAQNPSRSAAASSATPRSQPGVLDRLRATLAGTVQVAPGVDLTAPTGEVWDAEWQ